MSETQRLMTAEELKNHLHMNIQTIYERCRKDGMPHIRTGRKYLFELQEVIEWFRARQVKHENKNK